MIPLWHIIWLVDSEVFEGGFLVKYLKNSEESSKCGELDYVDKKG